VTGPTEASIALVKVALATLSEEETMTYDQLSVETGLERDEWQFALIDALKQLEEPEGGRERMFFLRQGKKGITRISASEAASELGQRKRRHIVRKAYRGLDQARNIAQSPDLSQEDKNRLAAHAASLAVTASAAQGHPGLGVGKTAKISPSKTPDWSGLTALYANTEKETDK
jgi:hypothetical protein